MPATISRLLMCFGVLIGATVMYVMVFAAFERNWRDEQALMIAGVASCLFLICGWTLTWRTSIRWTALRLGLTLLIIPCGLIPASLVYLILDWTVQYGADEIGIVLGTMSWAATWLIGTAIIWRENAKERGERLRQLGIHAVACPDCGYNLTGLREAKCPECGAAYTLDQLFATITEQRAELGGE